MNLKCPTTREQLNRLYWIDELTVLQMALLLGLARSTICYHLKKYRIPRRKRVARRSVCKEPGCERHTCKARRTRQAGQHVWYYTSRCAEHHHQFMRFQARRSYRRRHGLEGDGVERWRQRKQLGRVAFIAREVGC